MLIRKPRGTGGPWTVGFVIVLGVAGGVYIWGPSIQKYLDTDPEIVAWRQKSKLARELDKFERGANK